MAGSVALSVLAMLSKEQGITVLALCLVYDIFIFNKVKKSYIAMETGSLIVILQHDSSGQSKHYHWNTKIRIPTPRKGFFIRGVIVTAAALVVMVIRLAISNGAPSRKLFTE
jgi:hypothetical protein